MMKSRHTLIIVCFVATSLVILTACSAVIPVAMELLSTPTPTDEPTSTPTDTPTSTATSVPKTAPRPSATWTPERKLATKPVPSSKPTIILSAANVSAEITQLANAATMTGRAQAIFYAASPTIDTDRTLFEQHCSAPITNGTVELGCYTSDNRIYLLRISDPELSSEMVVTAAHEMLHAAYVQLTATDRATVNAELENAVAQIHSADLSRTLRIYQTLEPGQRDNELHSILGTEYAPLDAALEQYYRQYFSNRNPIVADAQHFDQVFTQLDNTLTDLEAQIISTRRQMRSDLRQRNVSAYNALVPQLNALVQQYNQTVARYNTLSRELRGQESPASTQ